MGAVTLAVADLDAMTAFYRDGAALDVLAAEGDSVVLGRGTTPALVLQHEPGLRHAGPSEAGLFHTAIVYETEAALAAAVYAMARQYPQSFTGSSDHHVSNAFYFTDPEGNGVELYWDRDRATWNYDGGSIVMGTVYLDPNAFLEAHLTEALVAEPRSGAARVGHVHLQVGDTATAEEFYATALGFEVTAHYGSQAVFVSAGGYHHHLAMNTWRSRGAGRRSAGLGLGVVEIAAPDADEVVAIQQRLTHHGIATAHDGRSLEFADPWDTTIRVVPVSG